MGDLKKLTEELHKAAQIRRRDPSGNWRDWAQKRENPHDKARIVQRTRPVQQQPQVTYDKERYSPRVNDLFIPDDLDFEAGDSLTGTAPAKQPQVTAPVSEQTWEEDVSVMPAPAVQQPTWETVPQAVRREPEAVEIPTSPELEARFREIDRLEREEAEAAKKKRSHPGDEYSRYQAEATERHRVEEAKRKAEELAQKEVEENLTVEELKKRAQDILAQFTESKSKISKLVRKKQKSRPSESEQKEQMRHGLRWVYIETPKTAFDEPEGLYVLVSTHDINAVRQMIYAHYKLAGSLKSLKQFLLFKKDDTPVEKKKELKPYKWR